MDIEYYPNEKMLYIRLRKAANVDTVVIGDHVVADIDKDGNPTGFEIALADKLVDLSGLDIKGLLRAAQEAPIATGG